MLLLYCRDSNSERAVAYALNTTDRPVIYTSRVGSRPVCGRRPFI